MIKKYSYFSIAIVLFTTAASLLTVYAQPITTMGYGRTKMEEKREFERQVAMWEAEKTLKQNHKVRFDNQSEFPAQLEINAVGAYGHSSQKVISSQLAAKTHEELNSDESKFFGRRGSEYLVKVELKEGWKESSVQEIYWEYSPKNYNQNLQIGGKDFIMHIDWDNKDFIKMTLTNKP